MGKHTKLLDKILYGVSDRNIDFVALCNLLKALKFSERIKGSHHIFFKTDLDEILNLQPKGSKAKTYQVRQVRNMILKYHLQLEKQNAK